MEEVHAQTVSGGNSVSSGDAAGQETAGETAQERTIETTSSQQDENGTIYKWHDYNDVTAEIYEISCASDNAVHAHKEGKNYRVDAVIEK